MWEHQVRALEFLEDKDAAMLSMAMRTGKSRVTVEALQRRQAKKVLIVCPSSVVDVWPGQFRDFAAPGKCSVVPLRKGSVAKRTQIADGVMTFKFRSEMVVCVINYESVWREPFGSWALMQDWDAIVCDESHRAQAVSGKAATFLVKLAKKIPFRLCLTGTPFTQDIFSIDMQFRILDPSIFGVSHNRMKHRYGNWINIPTLPVPLLDKRNPYKNEDEFMERFRRLAFEVDASVLNLPTPTHTVIPFDLSPKGRRVYHDLEEEFYAKIDEGEITASNAMVRALRLRQAVSGFGRIDGVDVGIDDEKQKLLGDMLKDINEPVVVFCQFHHDLDAVHHALELSGRKNELDLWHKGVGDVIAVQIQAGGVGIDLSRARIAIYYSLDWSLANYEQSLARLQAKDQTWPIGYYYLLGNNTIDYTVYEALRQRKQVIEEIVRR